VIAPLPSLSSGRLPMSVQSLVKSLHMYQLRPSAGPINFDTLPHVDAGADTNGFGYDSLVAAEASTTSSTLHPPAHTHTPMSVLAAVCFSVVCGGLCFER
jgi:hypothetical protein